MSTIDEERRIEIRETGSGHGFIRRLVGPSGLGERLKPFILLDHVGGRLEAGTGFGMHPHSGIATLTYHLDADVAYEDTAGQKGVIRAQGLEWMRAGGGTWHQGFIHPHGATTTGFQLWLALPPGVEDGPAEGIYVAPEDVPQVGNVRVLLGEYSGAASLIPAPAPVTYLDVSLAAGATWTFTPPAGQRIGWAYVYEGIVGTAGEDVTKMLVIFEESSAPLVFTSPTGARFLVGTAEKHAYPLVVGNHSVHTNPESLVRGTERIQALGAALRKEERP